MKREIKFRAWDDDAEQMIYSDNHEIDTADYWWEIDPLRVGCITGESGGNQFEPPEPLVTYYDKIMQFTGLKDKQGKEIYEGDILKSESWGKNTKVKNPYHVVEWGRVGWIAIGYNGQMKVNPSLDVKSDFEVIGNVYENPELLN